MLYISGVNYESFTDGEGCRCTIFVAGCKHRCPGCQNPGTWSFTSGEPLTDELLEHINSEIQKRPFLNGITISGGDPIYSANEVHQMIKKINVPHNNIWLYTGFTWEELTKTVDIEFLKNISVVVDGPYIKMLRDTSLQFRGSKNQRLIDVQQSISQNKIVLYTSERNT